MSRLVLTLVLCGLALLTSAHTIKHIIVVMEENRSFDHMLGWRSGVNGLNASRDCNFVDPLDPSKGQVCATNTAPNVALCDPNHDLPPTTYKIYGPKAFAEKNFTHPDMSGFVAWERSPNGWGKKDCPDCGVMEAFSVEHLPVMNGIADHFALFDSFHASIPGPTWPNRIMFMAATSGGLTETSNPWFLGETGSLFPQRSIFDQVASAGLKWKNYVNDTPWELFMESIAHNAENVVLMDEFFSDCRDGTLPHFAFINPRAGVNVTHAYGSNDQHPDHDIALGEMYYKDIYEALRASPQWNDTLLIITFDEHGGFYDHVPPPQHCPPPGDGLPAYPDPFSFDRLGIRIPTLLAGPWVPKGELISEPPAAAKPSPDSKYELTSIMATVRKILNITEGPLTARDAWAATFDHVLNKLDAPRTDCPLHLPNALPPSMFPHEEAELPINSLQQHISTVHAHLAGLPLPEHKRQGDVSRWLQSAFQVHKKATVAWKASKKSHGGRVGLPTDPQPSSALSVLCEPFIGQNPSFLASNWSISFNNTSPFRTISIDVFLSDGLRGGTFCLDTGDLSTIPEVPERGVDLATVGISKCYPSADPSRNRDKAQQWIHMGATIRPYQRQDLCLASNCLGEANQGGVRLQKPTTLRVCDNVISQHWSWQGPAAGNVGRQDEGMLSNGDAIFALVVDWSIVQKNQDQQQY